MPRWRPPKSGGAASICDRTLDGRAKELQIACDQRPSLTRQILPAAARERGLARLSFRGRRDVAPRPPRRPAHIPRHPARGRLRLAWPSLWPSPMSRNSWTLTSTPGDAPMRSHSPRHCGPCSWRRCGCSRLAAARSTSRPASGAYGSERRPKPRETHEERSPDGRLTAAAIAEAGIATWSVQPVDLETLRSSTGPSARREPTPRTIAPTCAAASRRSRRPRSGVRSGAPSLLKLESLDLGQRPRGVPARGVSAPRHRARHERANALVAAKAISAGEFQTREGEYMFRKAAAQAAERALHLLGEGDDEIERLSQAVGRTARFRPRTRRTSRSARRSPDAWSTER